MSEVILSGNVIRAAVTFVPASGTVALADVDVVAISPLGVETPMTPASVSANVFEAFTTIPEGAPTGTWFVRWESRPPSPTITVEKSFQIVARP